MLIQGQPARHHRSRPALGVHSLIAQSRVHYLTLQIRRCVMHRQLASVLPLGGSYATAPLARRLLLTSCPYFSAVSRWWYRRMNLRISTEQYLPLDSYAPLDPLIERGNYVTTALHRAVESTDLLSVSRYAETPYVREFAPMIPHPTKVEFLLNRYHLG